MFGRSFNFSLIAAAAAAALLTVGLISKTPTQKGGSFSNFVATTSVIAAVSFDYIVTVSEKGFVPESLTLRVGEGVLFRNVGVKNRWPASNIHPTHDLYSEFDPKQAISPGASWAFVFEQVGTWRYHDHLNPALSGAIVVEEGNRRETTKRREETLVDDDLPTVKKDDTRLFRDERVLRAYVKIFGPEATIERLHSLSGSFGDCHQPAHHAGHYAYEFLKERAFRECTSECHSGCYHGATEAFFKEHGTANLSQNLNVICGTGLNNFFNHQCIHGIGHGLMAWTNYELFEALSGCDLLTSSQPSCWSGAFMENIVGVLNDSPLKNEESGDGHVSKYLSPDPHYPCTIVSDRYKDTCYFLQTSRMLQIFGPNFAKVGAECLKAPEVYQRSCFQSMGRDVGGVFRPSTVLAVRQCGYAPTGAHRIECLTGAVQDFFWDPTGMKSAIEFCTLLTDKSEKDACYLTIIARAGEVIEVSVDRVGFCNMVEDSHQGMCKEDLLRESS